MSEQPKKISVPLMAFIGYFARLGTIGFGGPIALVGAMQRDLVDEREWISKEDYLEGLALAQLAPGPLAAQLAIYLGYLHAGVMGATLVGLAFVLPSFLMVLGLSELYVRFGGLAWMQAAFYGIGACVIGIIARSALKLVRTTLGHDRLLWMIFAILGITTAILERELIWLFLLGGLSPLFAHWIRTRSGPRSATVRMFLLPLGISFSSSKGITIFLFFAQAGLFVFGSGLAIVPFLYDGVVQQHHWLNDRQFLDAVAVAMITPGPVVITVAFIGYLVAGFWGAAAAAAGVFLPVYAVVIFLAPHFQRISKNAGVAAFVKGVTAAAVGAIAGAGVVLARRSIHDIPTALIAAVSGILLLRWRIPEPILVVAAGIIGLLLYR